MKTCIILLCFVGACVAMWVPRTRLEAMAARRTLPALNHEEIHDEFGQYALRYLTAEGSLVSERGRLVPNPDGVGHVLITEGERSHIGEDGRTYLTRYTAGFEGYQEEKMVVV